MLQRLTGAESIRQLPTLKLFKIRMDLEMEGDTKALASEGASPPAGGVLDVGRLRRARHRRDPRHSGRHAGDRASPTPPPRSGWGWTSRRCSSTWRGCASAASAPRGRDPLPPPRGLLRERDGRLEGAAGADHGARPADGVLPRDLPLLPAPHLRGLALLGLHDGPRPLQGGVRRDPRPRSPSRPASRSAPRCTPRRSSRRSACSTSPTTTSGGKRSTPEMGVPDRLVASTRAGAFERA